MSENYIDSAVSEMMELVKAHVAERTKTLQSERDEAVALLKEAHLALEMLDTEWVTLGEILDSGRWDEYCNLIGCSPYIINGLQANREDPADFNGISGKIETFLKKAGVK